MLNIDEKTARTISQISQEEWKAILILAQQMLKSNSSGLEQIIYEELNEKQLRLKIFKLLNEIGIPAHYLGHMYLEEAIIMCYKDGTYIKGITKRLYPEIATKFGTTSSRVERAIRHSVEYSFDSCTAMEMREQIFKAIPHLKGKPTNANAIATLTEYLRMNEE